MFISDLTNVQNLQCTVLQELKNHGIKYRLKKSNGKSVQRTAVTFGADISAVPSQNVTCCGSKLSVPLIVYEACNMLKNHVHIEGLFRKAGSQTRQKEIKRMLDSGGRIDKSCHAVDIAGILKLYLRALPEPIIGSEMQELLLRCLMLADSLRLSAIQNALLLLPLPYLYVLHYIMEFFRFVSSKSSVNRMDANNLAIVLAPSVMPLPPSYPPQRMEQHVRLIKFFIENASVIGRVPEGTVTRLDEDPAREEDQRQKKKRRSGSLTRMLNGLRKMVGAGTGSSKASTPDPLATPVLNKAIVKRKQDVQQGLSAKKRKEILDNLPQRTLNCTPMRLTGNKEHKRLRLSIGRKSKDKQFNFNTLQEVPNDVTIKNTKSLDSISNFNSKIEYSEMDLSNNKESEYVRIPKSEYEAIKNRVSAIENRISQEFNVMTAIDHTNVDEPVKLVQTAYEKTLEEAAILATPGSEQLAKRLSRELKIRQSDEHKIIRSPSARKIGTLRRRSRENVTKLTRTQTWNVSSQTSMQALCPDPGSNPFYHNINLRRGRPNTVNTGLLHPSPAILNNNSNGGSSNKRRLSANEVNNQASNLNCNLTYLTRNNFKRASSFHGDVSMAKPSPKESKERVTNMTSEGSWKSANLFLSSVESLENPLTGRASVAKLRSQNAGMVMAKARLFDGMTDSDTSLEKKVVSTKPIRHTGFARKPRKYSSVDAQNKYVANSSTETDSSLSAIENKHLRKVCRSPGFVSKRSKSKQIRSPITMAKMKENLNLSSQLKEVIYDVCTPLSEKLSVPLNDDTNTPNTKLKTNGVCKTPRNTPSIKRPLSVKSNKAFKVTQSSLHDGRKANTPLRVNHSTPRRQSPRLVSIKARQIVQN